MSLEMPGFAPPPQSVEHAEAANPICINDEGWMKIKHNFKLVLPLWSDSGLPTGMLWSCAAEQKHGECCLPAVYSVRRSPVGDFLFANAVISVTRVLGVGGTGVMVWHALVLIHLQWKSITQKFSTCIEVIFYYLNCRTLHIYIYIRIHTESWDIYHRARFSLGTYYIWSPQLWPLNALTLWYLKYITRIIKLKIVTMIFRGLYGPCPNTAEILRSDLLLLSVYILLNTIGLSFGLGSWMCLTS